MNIDQLRNVGLNVNVYPQEADDLGKGFLFSNDLKLGRKFSMEIQADIDVKGRRVFSVCLETDDINCCDGVECHDLWELKDSLIEKYEGVNLKDASLACECFKFAVASS